MGVYGEQIARLKLVREIARSKGRDDLSETDVLQLQAMVTGVADQVGDLLAAIPMTFKQYTKHDLLHAKNLIDLMGHFIPAKTLKKLNGVELTVLVLVAMLHDFGMYVEEDEKQQIVDGDEFSKLLDAMPEKKQAIEDAEVSARPYAASAIRDAVLADYFRKLHPERARQNIHEYIPGMLRFREHDLSEVVARISESHGWGVFETADPRHAERTIEKGLKTSDPIYGVPFNPQYVAECLRIADIMDFDRSRTPLALLRTVTDAKSLSEWKKHLQITGWTITDRDVSFHAKCTHPEHFVAVMEFLDWIDVELRDCRRLMRKQSKDTPDHYTLNLPTTVDRFDVEMADPSYVAGAFRFELDYERIMKILMDKSLYPDPSLFLRELLQNSLDACRVRMAIAQSEDATDSYTPRITVWDKSDDSNDPRVVFQDNGIGMSKSVIEKYFMRVGRSYYRSTEFGIERKRLRDKGIELEATSQFGIGFLSCFMVADRIEIETYNDQSEPLHVLIEGPTKYFTIRVVPAPDRPHFRLQGPTAEEDSPPRYQGTRITVHLRSGAVLRVREVTEQFAVNVEVPIAVIEEVGSVEIPVFSWERAPTAGLLLAAARSDFDDLSHILIPWEVPLDSCQGLRGRLWFWMLRDPDGNPAPRVGHLAISGTMRVIDPVRTYHEVKHRFGETVRDRLLTGDPLPSEFDYPLAGRFYEFWNSAGADERARVAGWFANDVTLDPFENWYSSPKCIAALASGDDSWMTIPNSFDFDMNLDSPHEIALHGVLLPGGVTSWQPMTGDAQRENLFYRVGVGYRLDARRSSPTPAANRLFIDPIEADKIAVPAYRALLRAVVSVAEKNGSDRWWNYWVDGVLEGLLIHSEYAVNAIRAEREPLGQALRLEVVVNGERFEWTIDQARRHFGRWVRVHHEEGIQLWSIRNRLLLFGHPTTHREGYTVVDLDTVDSAVTNLPW